MAHHVAVIDLGKTNSKVALVDTHSASEIKVITQAAACSHNLYPSIDHLQIEAFVLDALATLATSYCIDAITVTTHGATAALINDTGELVLPVIDYEFSGIDDLRREYDKIRPQFVDTGSPGLPGGLNIGAQLFWQQRHFASQFAQAHTLLTWPQYWVHKLTGERCNDVTSLGCHTDLYEPTRQRYSLLVDTMRWQSLMPDIRQSGQFAGTLNTSMAKSIGISPDTPVHTGIHDSNASLVPHLIAQHAPYSVVSTGTWFIAMAIGGLPTILDESRDTLLNVNAFGKSVPSARFMGGRERELLGVSDMPCDQAMNRLLSNTVSPSMLMPSTVTDTGPHPKAKHKWVGNDVASDGAIHDCAVTLYLALMTNECMKMIGSNGSTFIEGPLAHDKHYAQMLAAVSDRPVFISESHTGTSVGAAMLINKPDTLPQYAAVTLDTGLRTRLVQYAVRWQEQLSLHAR